MQHTDIVVWLISDLAAKTQCRQIKESLNGRARVVVLGPPEVDFADLNLGPQQDLAGAVKSCPADFRPSACLNLMRHPPQDLDCLPCHVLGYADAPGCEGPRIDDAGNAAAGLLRDADRSYTPAWMPRVQINLPIKDLLGDYRCLIQQAPANLEVGFDGPTLDRLTHRDLAEAKELLKGRIITSHLPFFDLAPGAADPLVAQVALKRLSQAAFLALELGAKQAVAHLGYDPRLHRDVPGFAKRIADNLRPLLHKLQERGCRLALENTFEPGPEPLLAVMRALEGEPGIGICLDLGHVYGFSRTSLQDWWEAVSPYVIELHLHDNDGLDDRHWPVGWGKVDWRWLYENLRKMEQMPVLTLEPHNEPHMWASLRGLEKVWGGPEELIKS